MSELRWILLGLGVVIIAGIYFLRGRSAGRGWRGGEHGADGQTLQRREPSLSDEDSVESFTRLIEGESDEEPPPAVSQGRAYDVGGPMIGGQAGDEGESATKPADEEPKGPQKIIVLHVAARGSQRFGGEEVVAALQAEGLSLGRFDIFHWHSEGKSESVFSVASMVEPGSFDLATIADITIPGLSLFLVLPGPEDAAESFSQMLITARNLAQKLGGEVLDEQGSSLSNQTAGHIREEIIAFQLRLRSLEDMHA